jgi:hypothetical protein
MRTTLGSLGAALAIVAVMATPAAAAGADAHSGSKGCATKLSCAGSGFGAFAVATDAVPGDEAKGFHDAGDHVKFGLPS